MFRQWGLLCPLLFAALLGQEDIGGNLHGEDLIDFLRDNYKTNTVLSYSGAREALYEIIDNDDGWVSGIYTNYSIYLPPNTSSPTSYLYDNGIDCEHIWPQSMYEGSSPMKSDMHHLRPSKSNVNSSRGNKPFGDILDYQTDTWYWLDQSMSGTPNSNIEEYSETKTGWFEPREDRKGDVARSMFYFFTMYSEVTEDGFFDPQMEALNDWHQMDPANEAEIDRTWNIAQYQGNLPNPFILDETLIYRAYFYDDFLLGDTNGDQVLNVLDIVGLVNIILGDADEVPAGDVNQDSEFNVLDVVLLVNLILS